MPGSRKLRFISLFIYGGVVVLLVYLAIFARGFSQGVGQMKISGHYAAFPLFGTRVKDVSVAYHGITLQFSRTNPLTITDAAGSTARYTALSVRTFSEEAEIGFENGPMLRVTSDGSSSCTVSLDLSLLSPASIGIPYVLRGKTQEQEAPVISWKEGSKSYILSLPEGSRVSAGMLTLPAGKAPSSVQLHASAVEPAATGSYASWLSSEASLASPESLRRTIEGYLDSAYDGWSRTRLTASGTWKAPDDSAAFSEEIGRAWISSSIPRGSYLKDRTAYQQLLLARMQRDSQSAFTLSSSPFIGNLREYQRRMEERETQEVDRIRGFITAGSTELLKIDHPVITFLLDHGPFSLVENAIDLIRNMNPPRTDTAAALGMVEAFLDYAAYVNNGGSDLSLCRAAIEQGVLPFIRTAEGGIFLTDGKGGRVDVKQSLRAGTLLERAGAALSMPVLGSIARGLSASALGLAGTAGFLPAALTISASNRPVQEGTLTPEDVLDFVSADGFAPREIPLYTTLGPGTWIWTAARIEAVSADRSGFRITMRFPAGLPHYAMIQGISPFSVVTLHGIAWRSDPEYAQYSDGWFYDQEKKTFSVKLTGKQETEEIVFTY